MEVRVQRHQRPDHTEPCGLWKDLECYSEGNGEPFEHFEQGVKQPDLFLEDTESSVRGARGEARSAVVQGVDVMVAVSAGGEAVGARCFKGSASLMGQGSGVRENEANDDAGFSPWRAGRWSDFL